MRRRPLVMLALLVACKAASRGEVRAPAVEQAPPVATRGDATIETGAARAPAPTFEEVERGAHEALLVDARDRAAFERLARLYYERGVDGELGYLLLAAQVLEQAERTLAPIHGVSPEILYLRGLLESARGRPDHAAEALRRALQADPRHSGAAVELAQIELRLHRPEAALALLEGAAQDPARRVEVRLTRATAYFVLGDLEAAEAALLEARRFDPTDPRVHWNLGVVALHAQNRADPRARPQIGHKARGHLAAFVDQAARDPAYSAEVEVALAQIEALEIEAPAPVRATPVTHGRVRWISEADRERERLLELERANAGAP